jgi:hypothetical protein
MTIKLRKGDTVKLILKGFGEETFETKIVCKVSGRKGEFWLDNGVGNDPTGPFSLKTFRYLGNSIPGFSQKIDIL